MSMAIEVSKKYLFGDFEVDPANHQLTRAERPVALSRKRFQVLLYLLERPGKLVTREELLEQFWDGSDVYEDNLTKCISEIRKALADQRKPYRLIETVPAVGYRFIGQLEETLQPVGTSFEVERTRGVRIVVEEDDGQTADWDAQALPGKSPALLTGTLHPVGVKQRSWLMPTVLVSVVLALAAGSLMIYRGRTRPAPISRAPIHSIAVLPLDNLSGDPAQDYFADGMTEALISNLTQIHALSSVISRRSVIQYKDSRKSLPEIARELKVDAVIEGSVQRSGGRVHVTARLIPAAAHSPVWSREYDRDLSDVLKLQSEIAREVTDEIRIQITSSERQRLASARSVNPQAYEAYLLGRYQLGKGNGGGWKNAIEYFERATQIAPDYAAAYAGLSEAWLQRALFEASYKQLESNARAAASEAVELDEQLAEAHISLGNIKEFYDWDWTGAEQEFKRALELDPSGLDAHLYYGYLLMHLGRHDEAIREGKIATQLDPMSAATQSALGRFFYRARRYEEALPLLQRAVEQEPRAIHANFRLGDVYAQLGRFDEAIAAFEKIREVMPEGGDFQAGMARVYALMGKKREGRQMISGVRANTPVIAAVYAALGDKDEAFRILTKAVDEHQFIVAVKEEPAYESLHSDPRWKVLLRRMNFRPE
jgi:TolB-like protein/DNA-binding winged helix-turn-helix (wHTH) protein/Tfp pilus assembly protein PilF